LGKNEMISFAGVRVRAHDRSATLIVKEIVSKPNLLHF